MKDEYLYLWAQWGVLNFEQYKIVLEYFGNLENAWNKITPDFLVKLGMSLEKSKRVFKIREMISFHTIVETMNSLNIKLLFIEDVDYPPYLKSIFNPPVFLFVRGKLLLLNKSLSVVGTRKITPYGAMITNKFVTDIVQSGFVVVSGLALGIDACAHRVTIDNGGITVAVLGSGVDRIYPSSNSSLAEEIIKQKGAIISEYPLGSPPLKHHFPERNRIISGLSQGLLVIEGGVMSGALITAKLALEQGREVFAIPNNITELHSGTNHLIRRGEAKLVENMEHMLEEIQINN